MQVWVIPCWRARLQCPRKKIILLAGVMLVGSLVALLMHDNAKPVGKLSRRDVIEIRAVVRQSAEPHWSWFKNSALRFWPHLARVRLTFHIGDISENSMGGIVTIHPDGTREVNYPFTVHISASGLLENTCRVIRKNGRWMMMAPRSQSGSRGFSFLPSNNRAAGDVGIPRVWHSERACPAAPQPTLATDDA